MYGKYIAIATSPLTYKNKACKMLVAVIPTQLNWDVSALHRHSGQSSLGWTSTCRCTGHIP